MQNINKVKDEYFSNTHITKIMFLNICIKINKYRFLRRCNFKDEKRGKDKRPAY